MELHLLVSSLPTYLRDLFFSTLRWEAKRRFPWSQERCAAGKGLLAQALERCPEAEPLAQEAEPALVTLRR